MSLNKNTVEIHVRNPDGSYDNGTADRYRLAHFLNAAQEGAVKNARRFGKPYYDDGVWWSPDKKATILAFDNFWT